MRQLPVTVLLLLGRAPEGRRLLLRGGLFLRSGVPVPPGVRMPRREAEVLSRRVARDDASPAEQRSFVVAALQAHRAELRAFARRRVPAADVDDVLQIASLRAMASAGSLRSPASARAWLLQILRNVAIDLGRSAAARPVQQVAELPELAAASQPESCRCSLAQVSRLQPEHAAVLTLVELRGVSLADAAVQLGVTRKSATVRLHRARKALRERLRKHCGVTSSRDCLDCRCTVVGCCEASETA